ncbi:hypothetical protein HRbin16_01784 [bacterium HR16]|nr:hypothetical protein HRbin16_01784 [bacterium HR16]
MRCTAGIWSLDKRGKWLGNIYRPLSLNRYLYCEDEPVNQVDPSGLKIPGLVERDWGCLRAYPKSPAARKLIQAQAK